MERTVQIGESSYLILWVTWVWKSCPVTELIGFIPWLQCSAAAEAFLAWDGHLMRDTWIWVVALKTERLEMGLLIMRAVGSETAPGGVLETKPNC